MSNFTFFNDTVDFINPPTAPAPTLSSHLTNKGYVDGIAAGMAPKAAVRLATTTYLDDIGNGTWTKSGSGVGAYLTAGSAGLTTLDSTQLNDGDRVLIKDEVNTSGSVNLTEVQNGIYVASNTAVGLQTVLTRSTDFDGNPSGEVAGGNFTSVQEGTTNQGRVYMVLAVGTVDIDVDDVVFTIFGGSPNFDTNNPQASTLGDSSSIGGSSLLSRSDHKHGITGLNDTTHGNRSGGSLHSNATVNVAGFLSASDKSKLDSAMTTHGVQAGGNLHSVATTSVNGFMVSTDKSKLDYNKVFSVTNVGTNLVISDPNTSGIIYNVVNNDLQITLPTNAAYGFWVMINKAKTLSITKVTVKAPANAMIADSTLSGTIVNDNILEPCANIVLMMAYVDTGNSYWSIVGGLGTWVTA